MGQLHHGKVRQSEGESLRKENKTKWFIALRKRVNMWYKEEEVGVSKSVAHYTYYYLSIFSTSVSWLIFLSYMQL